MTLDANNFPNNHVIETPICIIGSGAAGITLAVNLANKYKVDVTVLEGSRKIPGECGGDYLVPYDECAQHLYRGQYEGEGANNEKNFHFLSTSRRRFYGGSTNCWGGWVRPMNPYNFTPRPGICEAGWPVTYEELRPYYQMVQKDLQLGEYNYDDPEYWAKKIPEIQLLPINHPHLKLVNWQVVPQHMKRFCSSFSSQMDHPKIQLIRNANVLEIESNASGDQAERLKVAVINPDSSSSNCQAASKIFSVTANQYIVACGGIESIRLLLLSQRMGDHSGLLGRYFFTHPTNRQAASFSFKPNKTFSTGIYNSFNNQPIPGTQAGVFTAIEPTKAFLKEKESAYWRVLLREGLGTCIVNFNFAQIPHFDSRITLSQELDFFGQQKVHLNYQLTSQDKATIRNGIDLIQSALQDYIDTWEDTNIITAPNGKWNTNMGWAEHHMGATRMSSDPQKGVLDENMKIHSVKNVYVCSSSAWPSGDISNPTMTIIAFAHRLAQHLHKTYYRTNNPT